MIRAAKGKAGDYIHQVSIQTCTNVKDKAGGFTQTWTTRKTTRALVKTLKASEYYNSKFVNDKVTHLIRMRFTAVMERDRLLHGGCQYNITGVEDRDGKQWELVIYCEQVPRVPLRDPNGNQIYTPSHRPVYVGV